MKLKLLWAEDSVAHIGVLPVKIGNNRDFTIQYGGIADRDPMLYGKFPLSAIRQLKKHLSKCKIIPPGGEDPLGHVDCSKRSWNQSKIAHVGEAHCTIVSGFELAKILPDLMTEYEAETPEEAFQKVGLFDDYGNGLDFPMNINSVNGEPQYLVLPSFAHGSSGAFLIAAALKVPNWKKVRSTLGLPTMPPLPSGGEYYPHITIGYMYDPVLQKDIRKEVRKHEPQEVTR